MAAGSEDSDAVNLAQLKNAMTHYYSVKTTSDTDAAGNNNYLNDGATGDNALAAGVNAKASGDNATAVGYNTSASGSDAAAFGSGSKVTNGGVAVGSGATASGGGVAFGSTGVTASSGGLAVGMYGTNASSNSAAFGLNSTTATNSSVAVGTDGTTANTSSFAAGFTSKAGANGSSSYYGHNIAVGSNTAADNGSSAFGINATANYQSLAIGLHGNSSSAYATNQSIAVGNGTNAFNFSTAIGNQAQAGNNGSYAVALGNEASALYDQTTAIGSGAKVISPYGTALGSGTSAAYYATALGNSASANYSYATAIGSSAQATDTNATAVGNGAKANKSGATALGYSASATHDYSTAVGDGAGAHGTSATALGNGASANSAYDTAIGSGAVAGGGDATALGYNAKAQAPNATALGSSAEASFHAVAIGDATASSSYALAAGDGATAKVEGGVALGSSSTAYRESGQAGLDTVSGALSSSTDPAWKSTYGAISVGNFTRSDDGKTVTVNGTRQIVGVAAGTEDTDAVNVAQLKAALRQTGTGTIHDYSVNSANTTTDTNYNNGGAQGSNSLAAGVSAKAIGDSSVAIGKGAQADGNGATVIGQYAKATGQYATAFGGLQTKDKHNNIITYTNTASGASSTAFGQGAQARGAASLAFGHNTIAGGADGSGQQSVAFGEDTQALGGRSLAFGEKTIAKYNDSVAFGNDTRASSTGATAFGNRTRALSSYSTAWGNATVAADEESTAWGSDTIAGAKLDENGAVTNNYKINPDDKNEPVKQEQMDVHGNLAYIQPNGKTAGIKQMKIDSGDELHDYVVLKGKDDNTYVRDYQGSLWKVNVTADGTVTVDTTAGKDKNGKVYNGRNGAKQSLATTTVNGAEVAITPDNVLTKAHEGSNGYTIEGYANATAFGYSTEASGDNATAFGNDTKASAAGATAFGYKTVASGENSTAFGENSIAAAKNSLAALGGTTTDAATNAAAIGSGAKATLADSVALGSHSVTTRAKYKDLTAEAEKAAYAKGASSGSAWEATDNAIAVGNDSTVTRQITGVAAGSLDTDAVNVAQLKAVNARHTTVSVGGKNATADNTVVNGGNLEMTRTTSNGQANYDVSLNKDIVLGQQEENKGGSIVVNSVGTFRKYDNPGTHTDYPMKEAVKIDGTTISVVKHDGSDGDNDQRQVVMGVGQDTGGYVALYDNTGKKPTYIFNAISPGITYLKDKTIYPDDANEFGRLEYGDIYNGSTQFIATLDDGLKFSGDQGTMSTVKLNQELSVTGGVKDADSLSTGSNIGVVSTPAVEDLQGNITQKAKLELKLNKDLTGLNTVTAGNAKIGSAPADTLKLTENGAVTEKTAPAGSYVTGLDNKDWSTTNPSYVSGRAATEDQLAAVSGTINKGLSFTTNTQDATNTTDNYTGYKVVNRKLGDTIAIKAGDADASRHYATTNLTTEIANNGDITIEMDESPTFTEVTATSFNLSPKDTTTKDKAGNTASAQLNAHYRDASLNPDKNVTMADGSTGMVRLHYHDGESTIHDLATMDDGQIYAGDIQENGTPDTTGFGRKMNEKTTINGGVTDKDNLTDGNIGVVSNGTDTLTVKLAKELKDLTSVTTGKTVLNNGGVTITNDVHNPNKTVAIKGDEVTFGGNQVTNMGSGADGTADGKPDGTPTYNTLTNGANIGDVKNIANSTTDAAKLTGDSNITVTYNDATADGKNTVKLNDSITLGNDNDKKVTIDGTAGVITAGDKVSLDGNTGMGSIGGVTIGNQTGVATTKMDGDKAKTENGTFVTGLSNKTWNPDSNGIVSGRAATEDQLKAVSDTVNAGWELDVNGTKQKAVTPTSPKVNFVQGQNISISGSGDDVTVATADDVRFTTIHVTGDKNDSGSYTGGITIGKQSGGSSANPGPGYYITGLENKSWNKDQIQSGRAATEDQLKQVAEDIKHGTVDGDKYVTGGNATYGNDGKGSAKLTGTNGLEGTIDNLHDYYVTKGEVSDDGKTLTMTKNDGSTFNVSLDKVMQSDMRLVKNPASNDGKYTVDNNGNLTLMVQDANGTESSKQTITLSGLASKAEVDKGLNFAANSGTAYNAKLGGKVTIKGSAPKTGHDYSEENLTTEVDANGNITIKMDKDLTANTVMVSGKDGKDGQVGITGKDGADGTVTTIIKTIGKNGADGKNGTPGVNGTDGITRIVYQDGKDGETGTTTHTVATLDDGLKFGANAPVAGKIVNPVGNKMNSTIKITGDGDKELDKYSGKNLLTSVEQDGDGNTTIHVLMDKNISADSMVVGQAGKNGKDGYIGINGKDGADGITTTIIRTEKGQPGADGKNGKPGVDGTDITRIVYQNGADNKTVATLDDGLKFSGDDNSVITKKLNEKLQFVGGADKDKLTQNNIGINELEDGKLTIQLVNTPDLGDKGNLKAGEAHIGWFDGDTLNMTKDGTNPSGNKAGAGSYATGLSNKDWDTDSPEYVSGRAATEDQLAKVSETINNLNTAANKRTVVTVNDKSNPATAKPKDGDYSDYDSTNGNLMIAAKDENGKTTYNIKLNDQLAIGQKGEPGVAGKDGKVTVETKGGTTVVIGHDGEPGKDGKDGKDGLFVTSKDGADGVSITGPNGADGTDGKVGISGTDGKDAVSISGKGGVGHIGLTGPKGEKGKDGISIDITTDLKSATLGDGKNVKTVIKDKEGKETTIEQAPRIQYNSNGKSYEVATMDDGLKFVGDDGTATPVTKKLNDTLQIRGDGTYDAATHKTNDDGNIKISSDAANGTIKVALSDKINLHQDGSLTVGGDKQDDSTDSKDPIVIKHFDDKTLDVITGVDEDGKPITSKKGKAGDYVTGLDNKDWNVDKPEYVSGRAATEDQLKKVSDAVNSAAATAGKHTVVTVNDKDSNETKAEAGTGAFGNYAGADKGNLLIAAKNDNGQMTYNIKLNDQLAIGQKGEPGVAGKDGKVTVETKGGTTVVIGHDGEPGKDGKDGLFVTGKDGAVGKSGVSITGPNGADGTDGKVGISGTDGKDAVSISGKGGVGHIGLTGPEGEKGKDGISIDITTGLKAPTLGSTKNVSTTVKDTTSGQETTIEQAPRIQYKSGDNTYEVATMDDGLKIGANAAAKEKAANPVSNKLNSTINIKGSNAKADHTYTDDNLTTTVEQDADGNTTVKVLMDQDITGNSVTVGKDSKDGEDGKAGYDGQEGSIGIAGKNGIDGKNGKQGITTTIIKTEKGQNGKDGEVGKQGAPGVDGKDITRIVYQNGQDGENGQGGKHVVATLDDGLKFVGDDGTATPVTKKLNDTLQIRGDGTYDATTKTNNGNIQTSVESGTIKVALNKDINLKQTGSLTVGGDTQEVSDPIVIKHFDDKTLDVIGVDKDGKPITSKEGKPGDYVTGLDNKDWDVSSPTYVSGRAATEDQLKKVSDAVNSAAATAGKHTVVTAEGGKDAGTTDYNGENLKLKVTDTAGQKTYDLKLSDKLNLGTVGKDGEKGTDGSIGLKGADSKSSIGLNGKDGISVIGKDGKNGVSITGSNGLNGKDGIDGKIAIGTPGKDGQPGKDAVSISGQNGIGHIGLTGQKGEDGKDGVFTDLSTTLGTATLDPAKNEQSKSADKVDADDKSSRIQYQTTVTDKDGKTKTVITHEVATMDDGQKYAGDFGDGASVKLNKTVNIKGAVNKDAKETDFVDGNIAVVANKNGEDGELLLKLNKDLTGLNSSSYATTTKVDGKDVTSKTVVDGTGLKIDNGPSITNTGIDGGKHQITNIGSGKDGKMYDTTVEGHGNWNNAANIGDVTNIAKSAADGVQAKSGKNITVDDNNKVNLNDHITLGDAANKAKQVDIDGNGAKITAGDGNNKVTVDGSKGQIIAGGDNGVKIGNIAGGDRSLTIYDKDGNATNQTDKAGKYVTNLGNKTWNKDGSYVSGRAATEDQLHQVESNVNKQIADVNTKIDKVDKHHTEVTVNGGTPAKADGAYTDGNLQLKQTTGEDGQKVYDLKLNDQLKVGQKGDAGKAGKDGNVTVETKGGTTVVIGHDGKDGKDGRDGLFVTGKDGKNGKSGVSITGPNGVAGRDGVDGKVGIAGKDGRDTVSIAGRDGVGHIGLTGPKGADGKDGAFTDLSTILGPTTLDPAKNVKGKDGDAKGEKASRIHYETTVVTKDGEKTISHEVATMDDGMKYSGDSGSAAVKLNNNVQLYGGAKEYAAGDNIGVVVSQDGDNAKMQVKLAKDLKGIDSIDAKTVTTGNTTINNGGLTVKGDDKHKDITVQQGAVNMGGNKIEGVAPGRIAPDSTDAVNGSQLAQRDQAIGKLGGEVSSLDRRVDRVGAGAAALAALHPQDFDPDDKWDFAVGYGNYRGANAAAVGAFYRPNEDTTLSVGGTVGGGENMVNAGISFKFGQGNHVTNSRVAMAKELLALKDYVQKQDEKIEKLEALVGQQDTANAPKRRSILFPDVPENHWAYVYVKKLADRGLLEGYPDGEFKGTRTITRYEFAAIFSRALENGASVDGDMERMSEEFEPEIRELSLSRFRVDRVEGDDNDRHKIERVRVNDRDELVKQKNGEQKKRYRDVYGSVIEKEAPSDAVK